MSSYGLEDYGSIFKKIFSKGDILMSYAADGIKSGLKLFVFLAIILATGMTGVTFFYGWFVGKYPEIYAWSAILLSILCLLNVIFFEKIAGNIFEDRKGKRNYINE